jgi:hypothetical protein
LVADETVAAEAPPGGGARRLFRNSGRELLSHFHFEVRLQFLAKFSSDLAAAQKLTQFADPFPHR